MGTSTLCALVLILWAATATDAYNTRGSSQRREETTHIPVQANQRPGDDSKTPLTFLEASNQFSVDLMKEVFKEPGNFIMSPLTVSTLLAMLQQGAGGTTRQQLDRVLYMNSQDALTGFKAVTRISQGGSSLAVFKFGNSMYVNSRFILAPDYKDAMLRHFGAAVEPTDFSNPTAATRQINKWVSEATEGRITEIVREGDVSGRTKMMLVNAMYFKGGWLDAFHTRYTKKVTFNRAGGRGPVDVDMMSQNISLRAGEDTDSLNAKWIEMNFANYAYSMLVVLPNDNLDAMMTRLTGAHLRYMANDSSVRDVILTMPKFKINTDLGLIPTLQALGLSDMFTSRSNLGGITTSSSSLVVSGVIHKAMIDVHENGTEAAAVSSFSVETLSIPPTYEKMPFLVNKPFLAVVIDKTSTLPLFVAKVADPSRQ